MKIYLDEDEVIELAYEALDMNCPDPDKVHDIAIRMDMVYDEEMDMFLDVENVYVRILRNRLIYQTKVKYENKQII